MSDKNISRLRRAKKTRMKIRIRILQDFQFIDLQKTFMHKFLII